MSESKLSPNRTEHQGTRMTVSVDLGRNSLNGRVPNEQTGWLVGCLRKGVEGMFTLVTL